MLSEALLDLGRAVAPVMPNVSTDASANGNTLAAFARRIWVGGKHSIRPGIWTKVWGLKRNVKLSNFTEKEKEMYFLCACSRTQRNAAMLPSHHIPSIGTKVAFDLGSKKKEIQNVESKEMRNVAGINKRLPFVKGLPSRSRFFLQLLPKVHRYSHQVALG